MSDAKRVLLDALVDHAATHGTGDASLRELAAAVGSSHRMLIYHFGSRAGVVAAIVERVEATQRDALVQIAENASSPREVVEQQWEQLSDPAIAPFVRLFFEVTAQAMFERPGTEGFLDGLTQPWLDVAAHLSEQLGHQFDPAQLRLGVAVVRGLLLDAVASGDPAPASAALQCYLDLLDHGGTTAESPGQ